MAEQSSPRIRCESSEKFIGTIDELMPLVPHDQRDKMRKVKMFYFMRYGKQGLYDRVNNRTVANVLANYNDADDIAPAESGEVDGVRFALYHPPGVNDEVEGAPHQNAEDDKVNQQ